MGDEVLRRIRGYRKLKDEGDLEELRGMLQDVEDIVSVYGGANNKLELIRRRLEEIRAWGEEWKQYALRLAKGASGPS